MTAKPILIPVTLIGLLLLAMVFAAVGVSQAPRTLTFAQPNEGEKSAPFPVSRAMPTQTSNVPTPTPPSEPCHAPTKGGISFGKFWSLYNEGVRLFSSVTKPLYGQVWQARVVIREGVVTFGISFDPTEGWLVGTMTEANFWSAMRGNLDGTTLFTRLHSLLTSGKVRFTNVPSDTVDSKFGWDGKCP